MKEFLRWFLKGVPTGLRALFAWRWQGLGFCRPRRRGLAQCRGASAARNTTAASPDSESDVPGAFLPTGILARVLRPQIVIEEGSMPCVPLPWLQGLHSGLPDGRGVLPVSSSDAGSRA